MSGTIYGGTTRNGINIDDMVDNCADYVYRNNLFPGYFVRLSGWRDNEKDQIKPALCLFSEKSDKDIYIPLFAKKLEGEYVDYCGKEFFCSGCGVTELFNSELDEFWKQIQKENIISLIETEKKTDRAEMFELITKRLDKFGGHDIYFNGDEIICNSQERADTIADFLEAIGIDDVITGDNDNGEFYINID